jgi:hypothetical protein
MPYEDSGLTLGLKPVVKVEDADHWLFVNCGRIRTSVAFDQDAEFRVSAKKMVTAARSQGVALSRCISEFCPSQFWVTR